MGYRTQRVRPTCHCGHAKRTHRKGYFGCTSCGCQRYAPRTLPRPENQAPAGSPAPAKANPAGVTRRYAFGSFVAFYGYANGALSPAHPNPVTALNAPLWGRHEENGSGNEADFVGEEGAGVPLPVVYERLTQGWPKGVARMRETLGKIAAPAVVSTRRRGVWADQGDYVDRPRLYAGNVETCFRTTRKAPSTNPGRVRIVVDVCANGMERHENMFFRGAAGVALADALTIAGYMVELWAVMGTQGSQEYGSGTPLSVELAVKVKAFEAPLNLKVACATLAHPAAFRRLGFCAIIRAGEDIPVRDSLGQYKVVGADVTGPALLGESVVMVPGNILSCERASQWLRETLANLEGKGAA